MEIYDEKLQLTILTNGSWPFSENNDKCKIPNVMKKTVEQYDSYYC